MADKGYPVDGDRIEQEVFVEYALYLVQKQENGVLTRTEARILLFTCELIKFMKELEQNATES